MPLHAGVRVHGVNEVQRALAQMDPEMRRELTREFRDVARQIAFVAEAKVPAVSGRAQHSVRAYGGTRRAGIRAGGRQAPYFGWLDFGGVLRPTGRRRGTQRRNVIREGRFIYPAIQQNNEYLKRAAGDAVDAAARKAGF